MKEEIEEFKKQNGNVNYTVKELLYAVNIKLEKIDKRLLNGEKKLSAIETNIFWLKTSVIGLYTALGGFLVWSWKIVMEWLK